MNKKNTGDIGFEKEIWEVACLLRGALDASDYKSVILGIILLKYASNPGSSLAAPDDAQWSVIADAAHTPEIGAVMDRAVKSVEEANPDLKGALPKTFEEDRIDSRRLGDVVDVFTKVGLKDQSKDILGRIYEYCLSKFAQEGRLAGEFYTPPSIVRTLVSILKPFRGNVYDPACGSGGMFVQSAEFIEKHGGSVEDISIYGQETNDTTRNLAKMNLAIRGLKGNLGKNAADTFREDQHKDLRADYVMANPPFNLKGWGASELRDDPRWKYGIPPDGNANFAWMEHIISHLAPNGRAGIVLANGSLSAQNKCEGEIRKNIVDADLVEGVVAMPDKLFYTTSIPVCVWFLAKDKAQKGKTLFIDARSIGHMASRRQRELSDEDIQRIADAYDAFMNGTLEPEKGFSAIASREEIAQQDYILTPGRYAGIPDDKDDDIPFEEKYDGLVIELRDLFEKSHSLEDRIMKNIRAIKQTVEEERLGRQAYRDDRNRVDVSHGERHYSAREE